jgi:2-methylisocitrate lyase-like PEP mutase family enzyme
MSAALADAAGRLRELHLAEGLLVLPNAWDAASARTFAGLGHPALATTSAGMVEALGHADHEQAPVDDVFAAIARITGAVDVPVTADIEAGYGLEAEALVERLLAAGACGCNLEDTDHRAGALADPGAQAERLAAVKAAGRAAGVDLVVNARVDVYLHGAGTDEGLGRARRYAEAGADCVYPILVRGEERIARWVAEAGAPVNVLLIPDGPPPQRLAELGVRRATFGASLFRSALQAVASHPWAAAATRYSPASPLNAP